MKLFHKFLLGAAAVALADQGSTQCAFAPVPNREYREYFNPPNPVAGEALVGVAIVPSLESQDSDFIQVYFGRPFEGTLAVEITSADGSFRGTGAYRGEVREPGWARLELTRDRKTRKARPLDPQTLSIAVRDESSRSFLVARWGGGSSFDESRQVRLYVNGRRGDMEARAADNSRFKCRRLPGPRVLRFDMYCDLPWDAITGDGIIRLIRRDGPDIDTQSISIAR